MDKEYANCHKDHNMKKKQSKNWRVKGLLLYKKLAILL